MLRALNKKKHSFIKDILSLRKLRLEFTKPHTRSFLFTDFHLVPTFIKLTWKRNKKLEVDD